MAELRAFHFIDRLQPQTMSYLSTWIRGAMPRSVFARRHALLWHIPYRVGSPL